MNKNITASISLIKEKFSSLKIELKVEKEKNSTLSQEIEVLRAKNRELSESNLIFSQRISRMEREIAELKELNSKENIAKDKDLEIDFLVKEIDQCISQIKNNL